MTPYRATSGTLTLSDGVQTLTIPYGDGSFEWADGPPPKTYAPSGLPIQIDGTISFTVRQFYAFTAPLPAAVREARRAHRRRVRRQRRAKRGWR